MRITAVELENIKSYGERTCIELTEGLNAVCGLNGSGKTTVLEAIGWALFDFLPYPQQTFVREGQRSGTVRIRLLARDGREYEIVRKIGGGNAYYVSDVELSTRLADRVENVLVWVRTHALDIDGEADLKSLFKNAVGVPQGLMTAVFQESASARKSIFDPLLRVEEYGKACEYLRETVNYLRNLSATVSSEIAALMTDTDRIPDVRQQVAELREMVRVSEERLAQLVAEQEDVERRKAELDAAELRVRERRRELEGAEYNLRRHGDMLAVHEEALRRALEVEAVVREAEPGYRRVVAARKRLAELEKLRAERDGLNLEKTEVTTRMHGINDRIRTLDAELNRAIAAGEEAEQLGKSISRQDGLEEELRQARAETRDGERLEKQIASLEAEIGELEGRQTERGKAIARAREAREAAARLDATQERLQAVRDRRAALEVIRQQLTSVQSEGTQLRERHDRLRQEVQRREALLGEVAELAPRAGGLEGLVTQAQLLREERIRLSATIEYRSLARADLQRRHCPLLDLQCPAVTADESLLGRLSSDGDGLAQRLDGLSAELVVLERQVAESREAADTVQRLRMEIAPLTRSDEELPDIEARLKRCREQYRELSDQLTSQAELEGELRALEEEIRTLQGARDLASRLPLLEEQDERERRQLTVRCEELETLAERRAAVSVQQERVRELEEELRRLGDPRGRRQGLLALAERRAELETVQHEAERDLRAMGDRLKALVAGLQRFQELDARIEEEARTERDHAEDFERFLAHQGEARQREERQRAADTARVAAAEAQSAYQEARRHLEEAERSYDMEAHASVTGQYVELRERLSEESTTREHLRKQLAQAEEQLAYLLRREEKLVERRAERDELERAGGAVAFIRDTIKAAGPAVTESLLAAISRTANDIFADILDDHTLELRWDRDYEVLVQRGPEVRTFSQLSGGEQMSAALAVRLALLKEMSDINVAFFDEPTQNMDGERRSNLADQIRQVRGFDQLIVISHDDTFEHHTDNLIRLRKVHEETTVEAG